MAVVVGMDRVTGLSVVGGSVLSCLAFLGGVGSMLAGFFGQMW